MLKALAARIGLIAKRAILEFRRGFCEQFSKGEKRDDVYVLAMQFFSLRVARSVV